MYAVGNSTILSVSKKKTKNANQKSKIQKHVLHVLTGTDRFLQVSKDALLQISTFRAVASGALDVVVVVALVVIVEEELLVVLLIALLVVVVAVSDCALVLAAAAEVLLSPLRSLKPTPSPAPKATARITTKPIMTAQNASTGSPRMRFLRGGDDVPL